jgi:hypothetical protein
MNEPLPSRFPEPLADDDDDVAWALQTAKVQWQRGTKADAIVWLRRAADSADAVDVWRASDLRRSADELAASLSVRPPFSRPPPVGSVRPTLKGSPSGDSDIEGLRGASSELPLPSLPTPSALPSYASVDDLEMEVDSRPESFEEIVVQERESRAELISADAIEEEDGEADVEEVEPEVLDEDVIEDDALDDAAPLPAFPLESADPGALAYDETDELVTQPQLEDSVRFPGSKLHTVVTPPAPPPEPEGDPRIGNLVLGEVKGLEDIPPDAQAALVREAVIEPLKAHEEVSSFGLALVLRGVVNIMPAIADLSCARAVKGDIVWSQGHLEDGIALRLVAAENATEVAVWDAALIKGAVRDCPWVIDDLKALADRFQALAGVAMGPMGERLDDSLRGMVTGRCEIKRLLPNEELMARGKPVGGMYIVAAGRIEVVDGESIESELGPGEFLFGPQVLSNGAAPRTARAGKGGALVLFAGRSVAHELLMTVPPLLEIFAS